MRSPCPPLDSIPVSPYLLGTFRKYGLHAEVLPLRQGVLFSLVTGSPAPRLPFPPGERIRIGTTGPKRDRGSP